MAHEHSITVDFTGVDTSNRNKKFSITEVASYFDNVRFDSSGVSFKCKCPSHSDIMNSLKVTQVSDGSILLKCHAGCSAYDIMEEVGITRANLGTAKEKNCSWYNQVPINSKLDKVVNHYDYYDESGNYQFTKVRIKTVDKNGKASKRFIFGTVKNNKFKMSTGTRPTGLYNIQDLYASKSKGYSEVYITEGEKDADTMKELGFTAVTYGGAGAWRKEYARHFKGCTVYILRDNDEAGLKAAKRVRKSLKRVAHRTYIINPSDNEKGDITDFIESLGKIKIDEKRKAVAKMVASEKDMNDLESTLPEWIPINEKGKIGEPINDILASCIVENLNVIKVKPNEISNDATLYYYDSETGMYVPFIEDGSECRMVREYQVMGTTSKYKEVVNYMKILVDKSKVVTYNKINSDKDRILFCNGVYNLRTDELEPFSPEHIFTRRIEMDYIPLKEFSKSDGKVFRRFISDILKSPDRTQEDIKKLRNILLETIGLILSNIPCYLVKKCIMLVGEGNTGKSKMKELIARLLETSNGKYTDASELREIEENKFRRASLRSVRMAGADDMSALSLSDVSTFKSLTGGGEITAEDKGKDPFTFIFKGFFLMCMNKIPKLPKDEAVYDRLMIIECKNPIPRNKKNPYICEEMYEEKEYIVSLCMQHLRKLIARGFEYDMCDSIRTSVDNYVIANDDVYTFFDENFTTAEDSKVSMRMRDAYDKYLDWRKQNGERSKAGTLREFTAKIQERYLTYRINKKTGARIYPSRGGYALIRGYRYL